MAFLSSWLCTNNTKNMLVKIVHPGGHAELHDRPVLAAEIMLRNPRCCVAHRHVFRDPRAIVAPDTTLMPGQKFYLVPISTIRKLQRQYSSSKPNSPVVQESTGLTNTLCCSKHEREEDDDDVGTKNHASCCSKDESTLEGDDHGRVSSTCWLFMNKNTTTSTSTSTKLHNANCHSTNDGTTSTSSISNHEMEKDDKYNYCFMCLLKGLRTKEESSCSREESNNTRSPSSSVTASISTCSETSKLNRNKSSN